MNRFPHSPRGNRILTSVWSGAGYSPSRTIGNNGVVTLEVEDMPFTAYACPMILYNNVEYVCGSVDFDWLFSLYLAVQTTENVNDSAAVFTPRACALWTYQRAVQYNKWSPMLPLGTLAVISGAFLINDSSESLYNEGNTWNPNVMNDRINSHDWRTVNIK
jgi:hypothetical protein